MENIFFGEKANAFLRSLVFLLFVFIQISCSSSQRKGLNNSPIPVHPRLLFQSEDEDHLKKCLTQEGYIKDLHNVILKSADEMLEEEPVLYEKTGKRLLSVSRTCLKRVVYLSYSYRMTNDNKYLKRAEYEMLAAAAFADWNPTHFLDVAEMTAALAIGYDWLFNDLNENSKKIIATAIIEKGLIPSKNEIYNSWLNSTNNWNQVCNGGIALGAIAVYENNPLLAQEMIDRALQSIHIPQDEYEPDGAYPEGSTYWAYGTMYNILFVDAFRKVFTNRQDIEVKKGFMQSAYYYLNVFGPKGSFNYSDCRTNIEFTPAVFWYSAELGDNSILFNHKNLLEELGNSKFIIESKTSKDRYLPMVPIWASRMEKLDIVEPETKSWIGRGKNPVSFHRTSWDEDGIFIGIKGGSPGLSHAHMDIGSFVLDAEGIRWAMDLGKHEYDILESNGMDIWDRSQDSDRWKVFRYSNYSHNTITVNDRLQSVDGYGTIETSSFNDQFRSSVLDITSVYNGQLKSAFRGIAIADQSYVIVRDEIKNIDVPTKVRWAMLTHDNVQIIDDQTAIIRKNGKKLKFIIVEPNKLRIQTFSTEPEIEIEDKNPGIVMIGFELELDANEYQILEVHLIPGEIDKPENITSMPLSDW